MNNFALFFNSFFSYLLLFFVIVVVAGIAMFIGITMRKKKNAEEAGQALSSEDETGTTVTE